MDEAVRTILELGPQEEITKFDKDRGSRDYHDLLGIELDTATMEIRFPREKLKRLKGEIAR